MKEGLEGARRASRTSRGRANLRATPMGSMRTTSPNISQSPRRDLEDQDADPLNPLGRRSAHGTKKSAQRIG